MVLVQTWFFSARSASFTELEDALSSGRVDTIRVSSDEGLPPGGHGFAQLDVEWRDGSRTHTASVIEARPLSAGRSAARDQHVTLIKGDVGAHLRLLQPDLRIERHQPRGGISNYLFGREVTGWAAWLGGGTFLATLALIGSRPAPWRATRWAWLWLLLSPISPLAAVAYLTLGGATGVLPPTNPQRRLTGGWAFLIAFVVLGAADPFRVMDT